MNRLVPISGILATILLSLFADSPSRAMECISGPPLCNATPGDRKCSNDAARQCRTNSDCNSPGTCIADVLAIGGTAAANPNSIASVVPTGATNVTLTVGSLAGPVVFFRAVQTNPAVDGQVTVLVTDSLGGTCTVPISFHVRTAGVASNEPVCRLGETWALDAVSSLASPAGTTACSSHPAHCKDVLPYGYDFLPDSRIMNVRSSIAGPVAMELTSTRTFCPCLRFMFARSVDSGVTYTALTDVTTSIAPALGSSLAPQFIRLGGTGQWSDVRIVAAQAITPAPTLGQWGIFLTGLLLLTASSVLLLLRRRKES